MQIARVCATLNRLAIHALRSNQHARQRTDPFKVLDTRPYKMDALESQLKHLALEAPVAAEATSATESLETIARDLATRLEGVIDKWCQDHDDEQFSGGKMRGARGEEIERFVRDAVHTIGATYGMDLRAIKGDKDKKVLSIERDGAELTKAHQVDVHIYKEDRFVAVIECKAYLDSCYYVRACDDFRLFDKFGYDALKKYVFAMENSIDAKTKAFTDIITDNTCDDIFYVLDRKRVSRKPVYDKKHRKPVNKDKVRHFVRTLHAALNAA